MVRPGAGGAADAVLGPEPARQEEPGGSQVSEAGALWRPLQVLQPLP